MGNGQQNHREFLDNQLMEITKYDELFLRRWIEKSQSTISIEGKIHCRSL